MNSAIAPKDIQIPSDWYWNSPFQNTECEIILRNLMLFQVKKSPDAWTGFSWEDYKAFCTHNVSLSEWRVLDCFANGGKPIGGSSCNLESGWLSFDGRQYEFTEKMIEMLHEKYPAQQPEAVEQ